MAANPLDVLRDKLNTRADARLRAILIDKVEGLRDLTRNVGPFEFTKGNVTVQVTPAELVNALVDAWFTSRRDQYRAEYVSEFLRKVEGI